ncbi:ribosomal protein L15 [Anaeramoeba flamelloides]|uniref:Ribosomal protein L15 n=1 Tax=Anaeramoeba flamelloides TaxID=1746091 RepID=A0AAV7YWG1_9EUKA|nr:ribosomal protein L15 [Anaeramoeba flamelloides]KAJ3448320.1 ribosomal protein L15 [Anaeramoeba flamelloides]KAJ6233222.1 ribosomal protein L15 [Anaeramoeba flamelloides]KAJ6243806.1 ribosomal protein L15 [Anaeramoeba flamelloides]KAJ6246686.1 ribosomal protein L15 [Anaeramoeba flamelloides]|eukprot:Anaeramoba_flamelloidesa808189_877.p1 GENE.a808189_877~~a808189_877.p1  ORF type:complete len:205 (-),score=25.97 a808189_877:121-735(-)
MGAYKYVQELYRKKQSDVVRYLLRVRAWQLRQLPAIHRASRPSRPEKARMLGYKAKQGYVVYRVRVRRGGRKRHVKKGRIMGKPTNHGVRKMKHQKNFKSIAEYRVGKVCGNLRVLNSYWINECGTYRYYEVILVDPNHITIQKDPRINWITRPTMKHREARGLTSSGRKYRGLRYKNRNVKKLRPSRRGDWKRRNTLSLRRYR